MGLALTACEICSSLDDEGSLLLCDGCNNGYHTFCCSPPIQEVPQGDWFCLNCNKEAEAEAERGLKKGETVSELDGGFPDSGKKKKTPRRKSKWASGSLAKKKPKKRESVVGGDEKENEKVKHNNEKEKDESEKETELKEKEADK